MNPQLASTRRLESRSTKNPLQHHSTLAHWKTLCRFIGNDFTKPFSTNDLLKSGFFPEFHSASSLRPRVVGILKNRGLLEVVPSQVVVDLDYTGKNERTYLLYKLTTLGLNLAQSERQEHLKSLQDKSAEWFEFSI